MTTAAILPDGSVLIRRTNRMIRFDLTKSEIVVRAAMEGQEHGGTVLATYPCDMVDRLRVVREGPDQFNLYVDLITDRTVDIGEFPSQTTAMRIAWAVSDITRSEVWVEEEEGPPALGDMTDLTDDEPTTPIPYPAYDPLATMDAVVEGVTLAVLGDQIDEEPATDIPGTLGSMRLAEVARILGDAETLADEPATPAVHHRIEITQPAFDTRIEPPRSAFEATAVITPRAPLPQVMTVVADPMATAVIVPRSPPPEIAAHEDDVWEDDDPLDTTACRMASHEERMISDEAIPASIVLRWDDEEPTGPIRLIVA